MNWQNRKAIASKGKGTYGATLLDMFHRRDVLCAPESLCNQIKQGGNKMKRILLALCILIAMPSVANAEFFECIYNRSVMLTNDISIPTGVTNCRKLYGYAGSELISSRGQRIDKTTWEIEGDKAEDRKIAIQERKDYHEAQTELNKQKDWETRHEAWNAESNKMDLHPTPPNGDVNGDRRAIRNPDGSYSYDN